MSNDIEEPKKSFLDLSQYSDRTRKIVFGAIAVLLLAVVAFAIFVISPMAEEDEKTPSPAVTEEVTQAPVNPDVTATPTPPATNPETPEEEAERAQENVIDNNPPQDEIVEDYETEIPNADRLADLAKNGILAYCEIAPGETTEQRKAKMAPFFHSDNSTFRNPTEAYYERKCGIEAVEGPVLSSTGQTTVYVGVAWTAVLSATDTSAQAGYIQYTVIVDENGIVSFHD
jgi:hypothetical protein